MSRGSRNAREVLDEIRHVIMHLEEKDRKLQSELKMLKLFSNSDESDPLAKARDELMILNSEISRLKNENSGIRNKYTEIQTENSSFRRDNAQLTTELQTSEQKSTEYYNAGLKVERMYKEANVQIENLKKELYYVKMQKNGLDEDLESHHNAINNLHVVNKELNDEIAKLKQQNGLDAGAASSPNLASPHQSPAPTAARVDVEPSNTTMTGENTDTAQKHHLSEQPAKQGRGLGGAIADLAGGIGGIAGGIAGGLMRATTFAAKDKDSGGGVDNSAGAARSDVAAGNKLVTPPEYEVTSQLRKDHTVVNSGDLGGREGRGAVESGGGAGGGDGDGGGGGEEDYSDILNMDILDGEDNKVIKEKIMKFFGDIGLKPKDNNQHVAMYYVQAILKSDQYKPRLSKTAKYYNINPGLSDDDKIEQIWKFFSELDRLNNATDADFNAVRTKLNMTKDREYIRSNFRSFKPDERSRLSYELFDKLKVDKGTPQLHTLYKQAGFTDKPNKSPMIYALIENP